MFSLFMRQHDFSPHQQVRKNEMLSELTSILAIPNGFLLEDLVEMYPDELLEFANSVFQTRSGWYEQHPIIRTSVYKFVQLEKNGKVLQVAEIQVRSHQNLKFNGWTKHGDLWWRDSDWKRFPKLIYNFVHPEPYFFD